MCETFGVIGIMASVLGIVALFFSTVWFICALTSLFKEWKSFKETFGLITYASGFLSSTSKIMTACDRDILNSKVDRLRTDIDNYLEFKSLKKKK